MNRTPNPRVLELAVWLGICGSLIFWLGQQSDWGRSIRPARPTLPTVTETFRPPALARPFLTPSADVYTAISARPIFSASRSPAPPPPAPEIIPSKPAMKKGQFQLLGTLITPSARFAHLAEKAGGKVRTVAVGEEINGIRIQEISDDRIVLTQHDDSESLSLRTAKAPVLSKPEVLSNTAPNAETPQDHAPAPPPAAPRRMPSFDLQPASGGTARRVPAGEERPTK